MSQSVSIAMATYNGAGYLREQLESFAAQTRLPDEVILRDDRSADSTLAIAEDFAARAPFPVRVTQNAARLGPSKNFEAAIGDCSGDLIFLSDQDDVWFREKIASIESVFAEDRRACLLIHDAELTDAALRPSGLTKAGRIGALPAQWRRNVTGSCSAFRKELAPLVCPVPEEIATSHDTWLHRLAASLGLRREIDTVLQYYRRHDTNVSRLAVNKPSRLSLRERLYRRLRSPARSDLEKRIHFNRVLEERIRACKRAILDLPIMETDLDDVVTRIQQEIAFLEDRLELQRRARHKRIIPAFARFLHGGYKQGSGWKSLLKDIAVR